MRAAIRVTLLSGIFPLVVSAQTATQQRPYEDRLGKTCADILQMVSSEWVTYFGQNVPAAATDTDASVARATAAYGKCYDARTDALASALTKSGRGPGKKARADFTSFESAVKTFSAKALADAQPAADSNKRAFAALYEKEFCYDFYHGYEPKLSPPGTLAKPVISMATPDADKRAARASATGSTQKVPIEIDEMGKAKNRFGELLGALPDEKLHELHAAFGEILGLHEVDDATKLAVYRYAIFLLEPSSGKGSYPPPF